MAARKKAVKKPATYVPARDRRKAGRPCFTCNTTKPAADYHSTKAASCKLCVAEKKEKERKEATQKRAIERIAKTHVRKEGKKIANAESRRRRKAQQEVVRRRSAKEVAGQELARRELLRRSMINFTVAFTPKYDAGWVHKLICAKLEKFSQDVAQEKSPRLMLFVPPRHGKSEIASKKFPAWHLGHHPDHEIIASSYAVSLPLGFSRHIKNVLHDPMYKAIFEDTKLDPNAQATDGWLTTEGGGYLPAGVGGGITGKGAHILVIDDPVKDAAEADSETQRDKVWDWYGSTARTRVAPGGGILVIQTRWHDDDLAGRLLTQQKEKEDELAEQLKDTKALLVKAQDARVIKKLEGRVKHIEFQIEHEIERWEVIVFPATNTNGDEYWSHNKIVDHHEPGARLLRRKNSALHPERFDEIALAKIRNGLQKRHWSALYQQNPVPDEGVYFRKEMFRYEPYISSDIWGRWNIFIAWDLAIGQKQANDWTVGLVGAHDFEDRLHLIDMVRVKTDELAEVMITTALPYKKQLQMMGLERGQIQMAVMPSLKKLMKEKRFFFSFDEELTPVTDKSARARPAQAWLQGGRILLPDGQPWVETFTAELLRFPGGVHDDIVDSLAWLVRMVLRHEPPKQKKAKRPKSWKDKLAKHMRGSSGRGGAMDA